jgi:hypothetical protein
MVEDGYVMERLEPAPRTEGLLREMESLLRHRVWNRPAVPFTRRWREHIEFLGVEVPDWVEPMGLTLTHGDCTASNAMLRGGTLIIADPRPPRVYVPQCPETDIGRLLQSAMGWETVAYGLPFVEYVAPLAWTALPANRPKYLFWCGMAITRILHKERAEQRRPHIIAWCERSREVCFDSIGVRSR